MPNIALVLKSEIQRIARKVLKDQTGELKRSLRSARSDIAALRRQVRELQGEVARQNRRGRPGADPAPAAEEPEHKLRFSAKGFLGHRQRLGLTAREAGQLLGVSAQSVSNWEKGAAMPRASQLAAIARLRTLGKREARARLAEVAE